MKKKKTAKKAVKLIDCDCNGYMCCNGRGIAVFQVTRNGKKMKVCTRCDLTTDKKTKKILNYVKNIPAQKLMDFDALGAMCAFGEWMNGTIAEVGLKKLRL